MRRRRRRPVLLSAPRSSPRRRRPIRRAARRPSYPCAWIHRPLPRQPRKLCRSVPRQPRHRRTGPRRSLRCTWRARRRPSLIRRLPPVSRRGLRPLAAPKERIPRHRRRLSRPHRSPRLPPAGRCPARRPGRLRKTRRGGLATRRNLLLPLRRNRPCPPIARPSGPPFPTLRPPFRKLAACAQSGPPPNRSAAYPPLPLHLICRRPQWISWRPRCETIPPRAQRTPPLRRPLPPPFPHPRQSTRFRPFPASRFP
jgi:hypothetical protein